jgi:nitroreductase
MSSASSIKCRFAERNRSHRGYDSSFIVRDDQLRRIIEVNTKIPSARNQQVLRFRAVNHTEAAKVLSNIALGGALPELHLPFPGTEPNAFIIICSTVEESKYVSVDLGISAQSMLLQAAEIGLNGICIGAFNKNKIIEAFDLKYEPLLILAIGKGIEKIRLVEIAPEDSHTYYRKDGIHYVPKLKLDDLIIK